MNKSIDKNVPIKGVLSKGLITADFNQNIFFGQAIIDAYLLQEELKYYGIIITSIIEKEIINDNLELPNRLIFREKTPLKSGKIEYLNLSFYKDITIDKLKELYHNVDGSPRIYVDNTIEMFKKFEEQINNK